VAGTAAIRAGGGFDRVDGGTGNDTLVLGGFQSDYHLLSAGERTFLVTAQGAVDVSGVEQMAFFNTSAKSSASVLGSTTAFDALTYIAGYSDLRAFYGTNAAGGAQHFAEYGFREGRSLTFNALDYIASHIDLINAYGADATAGARHFIEWGAGESRVTSFNGWAYLASFGDLIRAYGADETAAAKHYIQYGSAEGRVTTFNAAAYAAANVDLAAAFGNDADALARHYVLYGYAEGRSLGTTPASPAVSAAVAPASEASHDVLAATPAAIEPVAHNTVSPAVFMTDTTDHGDTGLLVGKGWADVSEIHVNVDNLVIA
jgi:hypothetical protein